MPWAILRSLLSGSLCLLLEAVRKVFLNALHSLSNHLLDCLLNVFLQLAFFSWAVSAMVYSILWKSFAALFTPRGLTS